MKLTQTTTINVFKDIQFFNFRISSNKKMVANLINQIRFTTLANLYNRFERTRTQII